MKMRAISIRNPWAWLIVNGFKGIENRSWTTKFRGPVLIHASKGMTSSEYAAGLTMALIHPGLKHLAIRVPEPSLMERGGIVGYAEITDCVSASASPWFVGPQGFTLEKQRPLPFLPCKGALSFFTVEVPDDYLTAIHGQKATP
jgi:hypothetical protein